MKLKWRGKLYKDLLWKCALATTVQYFDRAMDQLKSLDEEAYDYLKKIPAQQWSKAHFSGKVPTVLLINSISYNVLLINTIAY